MKADSTKCKQVPESKKLKICHVGASPSGASAGGPSMSTSRWRELSIINMALPQVLDDRRHNLGVHIRIARLRVLICPNLVKYDGGGASAK